jgi:hypothetical protein
VSSERSTEKFNLRRVKLERRAGFRIAQDFGDKGDGITLPSREGFSRFRHSRFLFPQGYPSSEFQAKTLWWAPECCGSPLIP